MCWKTLVFQMSGSPVFSAEPKHYLLLRSMMQSQADSVHILPSEVPAAPDLTLQSFLSQKNSSCTASFFPRDFSFSPLLLFPYPSLPPSHSFFFSSFLLFPAFLVLLMFFHAGMAGVPFPVWFWWGWGSNLGLCACQASILPTVLHASSP